MADPDSKSISARGARVLRLGRSDDPISSLKAATRWADSLTIGDPLRAQAEIMAEVMRFNDSNESPSKERLLILMTLDEKSQDLQAALSRQYLRNPRMSRVTESELWHAIHQLNWEVLRGYHTHVFSYFRDQGKGDYKAMIPIITLRALRGFRQVIKWRSIRYMHPGEKSWARLHQLYQIAENQGFHQTRLLTYPDEARESSCEAEYLHILMLDQADAGSFYPRQIDLIDQWLNNWCESLRLEQTLDVERHTFAVDMTRDRGARRVRNMSPELSTRYWSTLKLLNRIKGIQGEIHAGVTPARLGLTENVRVAESLELLSHLVRQWGAMTSREQRSKPRVAVKKVLEIVHGFATIMTHVRESSLDAPTSLVDDNLMRDEAMDVHVFVTERTHERLTTNASKPASRNIRDIERWVMEDESECGYGTTTQTRDKDWLRVGALVGLRTDKEGDWSLGVVRRLSRLSETKSSVGFETLRGKPLAVTLHGGQDSAGYVVNGVNAGDGKTTVHGLILNEGDNPAMVLDPMHYQRKAVLEYAQSQYVQSQYVQSQHTQSRDRKTIRLGDLLEQGEGWVMCNITWLD